VQFLSLELATPPQARFHVMMVMAVMRPQQFHDLLKVSHASAFVKRGVPWSH